MATVHTNPGTTGAKRQSWRRDNPRAVLKRVIDENPEMSEEENLAECWDVMHLDQAQLRTVFEYWHANNYRALIKAAPDPVRSQTRRQERAAKTQAFADKVKGQIKAQVRIVLLDMILPSGKPLRDSTREELLIVGGWAVRIADQLQPNQTVAEAGLSERQLRTLYGKV